MSAPLARFKDLSIDAVDPLRLGPFWAAALGLEIERSDEDMVQLMLTEKFNRGGRSFSEPSGSTS